MGVAPVEWLTGERVEAAKVLLAQTDRAIGQIAQDVGLGGAHNLRRHFRSVIGLSGSLWREVFHRPLRSRPCLERASDLARWRLAGGDA